LIKKYFKKVSKIMVFGLLAAILLMNFSVSAAWLDEKYSMTYLYGGTVQQQIEYVERTDGSLHTVSPNWFDIKPDGSLKLNPVSAELLSRMRELGVKVVPFLSNHWDRAAGINALKNVDKLAADIAKYVEQYNLDGVNVDLENLTHEQKDKHTELIKLLRAKIPAHKEVSVAVAANPKGWTTGWHGSYDYTLMAKYSDYLMVMTYDEHYEGGKPGPVAGIGFVEDTIKYTLSKTTPDKIVLGVPFFGRIWSLDNTSLAGYGVPIRNINNLIQDYNAVVTFDAASQSPKAEFEVKKGDKQHIIAGKALAPGKYVVWYENDQSLQAKLELVRKYDLKGAGSWALGQENASVWENYSVWLNGDPAEYIVHTVANGDTLWILSQRFGVTVNDIKNFNKLKSDTLLVGQELKIPVILTPIAETPAWVTTDTYYLSVRKLPSAAGEILAYLNGGTPVAVIGKAINGFYPIRLADGKTGFSNADHITTTPLMNIPAWVTAGTTNLNIRQIPDSSGTIVASIDGGTSVTVTGKAVNNFYPIRLANGTIGYASADFITTTEPKFEITAWVTAGTTNLNVRQTPELSGKIVTKINGGTQVAITGKEINGFYPVRLADGTEGYVSINYITTEQPIRR